ncbi:MAG: GGDEF domain-containing protein [Sulfuricurvum sp.]
MNSNDTYQKTTELHDHVMGLLRSMKIPPFPVHYKRYFDQLFLEMADEALRKEQEDAEHKALISSKEDMTRYIDIAKRSLISFVESHADMNHVVEEQKEYIKNAPESLFESFLTFMEGLNQSNQELSEELNKAQQKIGDLTSELNEALATLTIDPMTKVGNRSAFLERMEPIVDAGKEKQLAMVLMMIDIDDFRYINQEHSHVAGDKVLYYLAQTVKAMIREGDRIYRYGGDKFVVVMTRCDQNQAYGLADKIRQKISQSKLLYMGKSIHVTVSIGVTIHKAGDTFETVTERAQEALYCAKKSHKNCTFLHDW